MIITVNTDGKTPNTANESDIVTIKSKSLKNISLTNMKSSKVTLNKQDDNTYTFTMPAFNINIKANYFFNKKQAFTGNVFYVDTQPLIDYSPIGLVKWTNRTGVGHGTNNYYTLYLPSGVNTSNLQVYFWQ